MNRKYIAKYLLSSTEIAKKQFHNNQVTLQFFQREDNVLLCGIKETLGFLEKNTDLNKYEIKYRKEGSLINSGEVILQLKGPYEEFGQWEGVIDGILARQSSIATNTYRISKSAPNKKFVFMGDRADHYRNQSGDGYAAAIGGIKTQVTGAHIEQHDGSAVGTMPHSLISLAGGDIVVALKAYEKTFPKEPLTALVDFNNDVISDSLKALKVFEKKLAAVRVDTSGGVSDAMFANEKTHPKGVTPTQIKRLRRALDQNGGKHVKIIASSGFNEAKVKLFQKAKAPVDAYGVGGAILRVWVNFTADVVQVNGRNIAKIGRGYKQMKNYELFKTSKSKK